MAGTRQRNDGPSYRQYWSNPNARDLVWQLKWTGRTHATGSANCSNRWKCGRNSYRHLYQQIRRVAASESKCSSAPMVKGGRERRLCARLACVYRLCWVEMCLARVVVV